MRSVAYNGNYEPSRMYLKFPNTVSPERKMGLINRSSKVPSFFSSEKLFMVWLGIKKEIPRGK